MTCKARDDEMTVVPCPYRQPRTTMQTGRHSRVYAISIVRVVNPRRPNHRPLLLHLTRLPPTRSIISVYNRKTSIFWHGTCNYQGTTRIDFGQEFERAWDRRSEPLDGGSGWRFCLFRRKRLFLISEVVFPFVRGTSSISHGRRTALHKRTGRATVPPHDLM